MNQKPFFTRQQNITSWILLVTMILLAGFAFYLSRNPAPPAPAPVVTVAVTAAPAPAESATNNWFDKLVLAVQVAIFAGFVGYIIGYQRGQRFEAQKRSQGDSL